MAFFPVFQDLENRNVLIVGGGTVALRKAEKLLPFGPKLTVVAPEFRQEFGSMGVTLRSRAFRETDIQSDTMLVTAACNDSEVNQQVYALCVERGIPVNVVDNPALCTFLFPSLVQAGKLTVGISTSGASPSAAIWLKENVERLLPDNLEEILSWLEQQRLVVKNRVSPESRRSACLKRLFSACMEKKGPLSDGERDEIIRTVVNDYE